MNIAILFFAFLIAFNNLVNILHRRYSLSVDFYFTNSIKCQSAIRDESFLEFFMLPL